LRHPGSKILSLAAAAGWRLRLRRSGTVLVVTNGCFDLLHRGHAEYLARARDFGGALLVAVNSDASVAAIKGPGRPIVGETDRAYMIASLEVVDAVVLFSAPTATATLRAVEPDVYVKGGDYTEDRLVGEEREVLKRLDADIRFVPLVAGLSTTELIGRIRNGPQDPSTGGHTREPRP
jgi:D-beta-D-heptose 7-phosphate kinase/D-beta-D-heptose 1-phosphate adenosyltransferase